MMAATAEASGAKQEKPKSGMVAFLGVTLMLAGLAGGGGHLLVKHTIEQTKASVAVSSETEKQALPAEVTGTRYAVTLAPIVTNLATPDAWMRVETALILDHADAKPSATLQAEITADILAYARSLTLAHVSGPSGFLHFKSDLTERAQLRSDGLVKDVLVLSLVME
jgi:flagellar protein FliL